jgi:predicted tellurium resistance membrane protein TerC
MRRPKPDGKRDMDITGLLTEAMSVVTPEWWRTNWDELVKIIMIDVVLAGDNAIVVGLAASRVAPEIRNRVIFWGITAAVVLRILFAAVTTQLLQIIGLTLAGGRLSARARRGRGIWRGDSRSRLHLVARGAAEALRGGIGRHRCAACAFVGRSPLRYDGSPRRATSAA